LFGENQGSDGTTRVAEGTTEREREREREREEWGNGGKYNVKGYLIVSTL